MFFDALGDPFGRDRRAPSAIFNDPFRISRLMGQMTVTNIEYELRANGLEKFSAHLRDSSRRLTLSSQLKFASLQVT